MKKITVFTLLLLTGFASAKNYGSGNIHVQHHGKIANIPSNAPIMTRQAAATRNAIRVRPLNVNQRGVARITGSIRGLGMASYRFHGQAGQQVRISPIGNNYSMLFGLFDQARGMNFGNTHVLPTTGEYEVRIVQTRKNAARNRKHYRYDANVYLGSAAANQQNYRPSPVKPSVKRPSPMPVVTQEVAPRPVAVRHNTSTRHVSYSDEPVVSYLKGERRGKSGSKNVPKTKSVTTNYRCQSGGNLQVVHHNASSVTVKSKKLAVKLQKDPAQSTGANQIYTGKGGFLHLVQSKNTSQPEVLSFEYKGKTIAFGCK